MPIAPRQPGATFMRSRSKRRPFLFYALQPFLVALKMLDAIFLSWWLDRRLAKKADKLFALEIGSDMHWLLAQRDATIVPNEEDEYTQQRFFDYAVTTIRADGLMLKLARCRGDLSVFVRHDQRNSEWQSLALVLPLPDDQLPRNREDLREWSDLELRALDRFLELNWPLLTSATPAPPQLTTYN